MSDYVWLFLVFGILLLLIEIFIVPGLGLAGVVGFGFLMIAVYFIGREYGSVPAILSFVSSMLVVGLGFVLFLKTSAADWLVMKTQLGASENHLNQIARGLKGRTITPLYPSGKAAFVLEGREVFLDVSTAGEYIDKGFEVEVERLEAGRIFVRSRQT